MRVAIIQEQVDVRRGGAETSTIEMASRLAALGPSVTIVCAGERDDPCVRDNVTYLPLPIHGPTRALRTYRFVQGVHRLCRTEQFDIVHAVTPCLAANVYQPRGGTYAETVARSLALAPPALRWLKRLGRRFNTRQRFLYRVEKLLLGKHSRGLHVAALSEYVRQQVLVMGRVSPERVRVVFNGVESVAVSSQQRQEQRSTLRRELGLTDDARLVLFAAHNFKLKGLAELLRAHGRRHRAGAAEDLLVIVGRDNPRRFRRLAWCEGVQGRVRFVGPQEDLEGWYAAADALAHPTWYDPCSRVVLEALSCGLPVVTTRYNGAAEVIEPGRHGFVVDEPGDCAALAAALDRALEAGVRAACEADAGRMRDQLSMQRHARGLIRLYEDVLAGR